MIYNDMTKPQYDYIRKIRNEIGTLIFEGNCKAAFDGLLQLKQDIKKQRLHPSTFDNLLEEILAIAGGLGDGDPTNLMKFGVYISTNRSLLNPDKRH